MKPGDAIALVTTALGFRECHGCRRRKSAMNAVDTSQPILDVAADLVKAVVSPGVEPEATEEKPE